MPPQTKQAFIFDLFFTLVSPRHVPVTRPPSYERLGIPKPVWREETFSASNPRLVGKIRDPYEIIASIAHAIDPDIKPDLIRVATEERIRRFDDMFANVPPHVLETLRSLRDAGYRLALLSNADALETAAWETSLLAPLFDEVVFSWEVGLAKPDPKIYEHCLSLLGMTAADCVFVGDGGSDELAGAQELGMESVMVAGLMPELDAEQVLKRESQASYRIEDIRELMGRY